MRKSKDPLAISKSSNVLFNILLATLAALAVLPFLFVIIISLTNEDSLAKNGYSFFPKEWSFDAYRYILTSGSEIMNAYGVSIFVTVVGVILGLLATALYAYALSRDEFAYRNFFNMVTIIPMFIGGGLVATYLIMTQFLGLKNSIWALIIPGMINTFHIIVMRTFFKTTIPNALIESAKIDGANEWQIFSRIVVPISLPGLATIALFLTLGYWNDWMHAMLYISKDNLIPLQYLLVRIQNNMDFLNSSGSSMGMSASVVANSLPKESARMAIVVITTLPIACAYPFFQKYFVQGLTVGAVKE